MNDSRIIVALDYPSVQEAIDFVSLIEPGMCKLKVGKELFTLAGPDFVRQLVADGFDVFLDLKFHDIPNTVAQACKAAASLGVWMMNVHALGGETMMRAAKEALEGHRKPPLLIAVTVLTSMSDADLQAVGLSDDAEGCVLRLATLAQKSGLDGVVCSSREVTVLREHLAAPFALVTPGIRPAGSQSGDQKRIMTPVDAVQAGSDYLVIGRPVTRAQDPRQALMAINQELAALETTSS